jgi:hypothetical protein
MADGEGCKCAAHSESECACDADWTPQEVFDLRSAAELLRVRIKVLETAVRLIAEQDATLSVCEGNVTVTMDATLTDEEREAIGEAIRLGDQWGWSETLRGLLERLGGER